ncbi:MAG: hypothetical protein HZA19_03155 [Nitrospirae bacterium]|nr:hypothetical protein [Nitrospirota bacterium]
MFQDTILGLVIFGITGTLIGIYLDSWAVMIGGGIAGSVLGFFIGKLGARRFFLCVLVGTAAGGFLGWYAGGAEVVRLGAGTGSAIGGFIGINIELFMRPREK